MTNIGVSFRHCLAKKKEKEYWFLIWIVFCGLLSTETETSLAVYYHHEKERQCGPRCSLSKTKWCLRDFSTIGEQGGLNKSDKDTVGGKGMDKHNADIPKANEKQLCE